ncbi:MAG: hypothetical protein JWM28_4506, partial [Chitinophagaceae bacterium]|nr:hypothetical protein [Chitinophagaceae bacterium]
EPVGAGGFIVTVDKDERDNAAVGRDFDGSFSVQRENTADSKFTIGTGGVDISLKIGTTEVQLFTVISNNVYTSVMMLPYVDMPGNLADPFFEKSANFSPYVNNAEPETVPALVNDFGLRFLIYWGMQQDSKGNKYPYASPVSYDSQYKVFGKLSLRPGEPDDIWNRYQKPYYEFLAYSTRTTALLKISIAKLSEVSPNEPIGLRLKNYVLGRYILEKLTYELPSNEGFVLAKFEGRQLNPKLLRALPPSSDLFLGIWVKFVIENFRNVSGNGFSDQYGDVVLLAYLDGNFTIPAPSPSLVVNYKVATLTLNTNGQSTTTYKTSNVTATQSRTVLEHDIHLSTTLFLGGWKLNNAWIIQNGAGYRTRL